MARQRLSTKMNLIPGQKYERLDRQDSDFTGGTVSIHHAWLGFIVEHGLKGNSKATVDYYNPFYKKLQGYIEQTGEPTTESLYFIKQW